MVGAQLLCVGDIFTSTALAVLVDRIQLGNNLRKKNQINLTSYDILDVPNKPSASIIAAIMRMALARIKTLPMTKPNIHKEENTG